MTTTRFRALVAILLIGLGLVLAPAVFQMFSRAPKGGRMMNGFRPYMTEAKLDLFDGYMAEMDRASAETRKPIPAALARSENATVAEVERDHAGLASFNDTWPTIRSDMGSMLRTIRANLPNFEAVDSLPPFALFPWFFVVPGLMIAGIAGSALLAKGSTRGRQCLLAVLGVALILAPAVFQMFSRAPKGADMINDFRSLMTERKVSTLQGYFLVLAGGEGDLRTGIRPVLQDDGIDVDRRFPATARFIADWPKISNEMAPMVGAMADNLGNYAAVKALPPFWLFPWFFVLPGLLVAVLAVVARSRTVPAVAVPQPAVIDLDRETGPAGAEKPQPRSNARARSPKRTVPQRGKR